MSMPEDAAATQDLVARYVYCVVLGEVGDWELRGLDERPVRAICAAGLTALVHDCPAVPYQGDDVERVKVWVLAHSDVVDAAWERTGTVLPMSFDRIVRPGDGRDADEQVAHWLTTEGDGFRATLERLRGKVELGVQLLWEPRVIAAAVAASDAEIQALQADLAGKSKGAAYFSQQKIERALRQALTARAEEDYRACFREITALFPEVCVNELKKVPDRQMILNLSVLVPRERVSELGAVLTGFQREGIEVRFTGPWPPYSFVRPSQAETEPEADVAG
ncbi:MAG: GvpL/GvpF family gas vesicle protein [Actinomycetes bacterium]